MSVINNKNIVTNYYGGIKVNKLSVQIKNIIYKYTNHFSIMKSGII